MPKPTGNLPDWDTTKTNAVEPSAGLKSNGYATNDIPTSANVNWWQNKMSEWAAWLNELTPGSNLAVPNTKDFQYVTPPTRTFYCDADRLGFTGGNFIRAAEDRVPYLDHDNTLNTPGQWWGRILVPGGAVVTAVDVILEGEGGGGMTGKVTKFDGLAVTNLETGGGGATIPTVVHSGFGLFARSIPLQGGQFTMPTDGFIRAYISPALYAGYIGVVPSLRVYGFRVTCTTANVRPNT